MRSKPVDVRTYTNCIVVVINYLLCNFFLYEYFFAGGDPFWKGLLYFLIGITLTWFIIDIWRGWTTTNQFHICIVYLISLAGMFLLFGFSMLYLVKDHPVLYFFLFNSFTWNIALFNLLRGITYKIFLITKPNEQR